MFFNTLSIDIAIKNLAFCLFDESKIIDWKLINLINDNDFNMTKDCSSLTKSKNKCNKSATYVNDNNTYFCTTHAKNNLNCIKLKNKLLCCKKDCKKDIYYYNKDTNEGFCKIHKSDNSLIRHYTVDNITDVELRILLFSELDKHNFNSFNLKHILIERQPKHATEKMRSLAYAVFDYFIIKFNYDPKIKVVWVDPKNKLTIYDGPVLKCPDNIKDQYKRNKWFACEYCKWYLNKRLDNDNLQYLLDSRKQDDLADCYLQGIYYIENKQTKTKTKTKKPNAQQMAVFRDMNLIKYKKIRVKRPNKNVNKNYTLGEIKHILTNYKNIDDLNNNIKLINGMKYFFGDNVEIAPLVFNGEFSMSIINITEPKKKISLIKKK